MVAYVYLWFGKFLRVVKKLWRTRSLFLMATVSFILASGVVCVLWMEWDRERERDGEKSN